jgi:hypothetical protein
VRAGYGIFFDTVGITTQSPIQTGYTQDTSVVPSLDNGVTFRATLANPFPDGLLQPVGNTLGISTYLGRSITFFNPSPRRPYNQRWSLSVQRQFLRNFMLDVGYVGSRGTGLLQGTEDTGLSSITNTRQLNGTPLQYLSTSPVRDQATINRLTTQVPNPFYPLLPGTSLSGQTVSVSQLLTAYPQYTGVGVMTSNGYSWYHALQTRVEKRFSKGYTLMGSWTWSKNMEAMYFLNSMDPVPAHNISPNDRTQRFVANGIYELPFGKGRKFAAGAPRFIEKIIGGWQLEGIWQFQTGQPLGLGDFIYYGDAHNIVLPSSQRTIQRWFNTDNFERSSQRQRSSAVRTAPLLFSGLRSAPITYLDTSLIKKTKITERFSCDLRAEAINALNHAVFEAPDTSVTSSTFGMVTTAKALPRTLQFGLVVRF